ncbi:hypothetical protein K439DRAFT_614776 [Ramaria rubella]|nr:hypothetical protein K439DRAFT_614776 [Ramaria rubella]
MREDAAVDSQLSLRQTLHYRGSARLWSIPLMASETTPLLPVANGDVQDRFPPILSAAKRLPPDPSLFDFQDTYPHRLGRAQPLRAVAFRLLLVLHLLASEKDVRYLSMQHNTIQASQELHEQTRRRENLRRIASAILGYIPVAITDAGHIEATEAVPQDVSVEYILFASFIIDPQSSRRLRVIDLFPHPAIPGTILGDPLISLSLVRIWKFGRTRLDLLSSSESSLARRLLTLYDVYSAPRAVHAVHLIAHLVYLLVLADLILYPSPPHIFINSSGGDLGIREPIIIIYSIADIIFNQLFTFAALPHVLLLLSFIYSLPASPAPDTSAYTMLLLTLCLHILFLHSPTYPTLLLLFEPSQWLPSSSLFVACIKRCLLPAFVFLSFVFLASMFLLSLSLSDTISSMREIGLTLAAPPSARLAFLSLFCVAGVLFLFYTFILLLSPSSVRGEVNTPEFDWERYGVGIGLEARRCLIQAILAYSPSRRPYNSAYPPPLNLLSLPLVVIPLLSNTTYKFAWRLLVGPFAFVAAGLWLWRAV